VAFGRALMSSPRRIIMDEPSMGLAPALVDQNFEIANGINAEEGVAIFVENARALERRCPSPTTATSCRRIAS
jgi:branched-chain amino acid transport system ATP-binding protein